MMQCKPKTQFDEQKVNHTRNRLPFTSNWMENPFYFSCWFDNLHIVAASWTLLASTKSIKFNCVHLLQICCIVYGFVYALFSVFSLFVFFSFFLSWSSFKRVIRQRLYTFLVQIWIAINNVIILLSFRTVPTSTFKINYAYQTVRQPLYVPTHNK